MKTNLLALFVFMILANVARSQQIGDISSVTDVDGNVYETKFQKDNNWWMMENLKVTKTPDGKAATFVYPWNGTTNDATLVGMGAGLLYDRDMLMGWPHALGAQGLCPNGWHVPSRDEIENLLRKLGKEPNLWAGDGAWAPLATELNLGPNRGGKWDPTAKSFTDPAFTGWGVYIYTSTSAYGNKDIAFMLAIANDGTNGGITQDPKNVASNCRCAKNKEVKMQVTDVTDNGLKISLSDSVISKTSQVQVYDVTDPTDKWKVDLTSVAFSSTDKKNITVSAYLDVTAGNKYEVRFTDTQAPTLPIGGINFVLVTGVSDYKSAKMNIWPNPVVDVLNISMKSLKSVQIYNISGQLVFQVNKQNETASINISKLNSGIYFVKANNEAGLSVTNKIIKK